MEVILSGFPVPVNGSGFFSPFLSLLVDHSFFFHPRQKARLENKLSAYTVGSLQQHLSEEALLAFIQDLITADDPHKQVAQLARLLEERIDTLRPSTKHMVGREMGRLEPAPSLKYRASA